MTNEQILKKAIEKTIKNGWKCPDNVNYKLNLVKLDPSYLTLWLKDNRYYSLIFSHDFAKAFWGEKFDYFNKYDKKGILLGELLWQYHLQQMILEEEPLKYIEKFLKDEPKK